MNSEELMIEWKKTRKAFNRMDKVLSSIKRSIEAEQQENLDFFLDRLCSDRHSEFINALSKLDKLNNNYTFERLGEKDG